MDRLRSTDLGQRLQGKVFLSVHEAFEHATLASNDGFRARKNGWTVEQTFAHAKKVGV